VLKILLFTGAGMALVGVIVFFAWFEHRRSSARRAKRDQSPT
jgi:hypothetical protein